MPTACTELLAEEKVQPPLLSSWFEKQFREKCRKQKEGEEKGEEEGEGEGDGEGKKDSAGASYPLPWPSLPGIRGRGSPLQRRKAI